MNDDSVFDLLPAHLRGMDDESGGVLRALLSVLAGEARHVRDDAYALLDDLFIETCDEWLVPYIGRLLRVRAQHTLSRDGVFSARARVANTIRHRRRKGTLAVLETLARDATGWPTRAVEFFATLGWTQHQQHVRPAAHGSADLRQGDLVELTGGPFDALPYTVDVRSLARGGRHNLPHIGLFVWRLDSYHLAARTARPAADPPDGRYFVDPLGRDRPLCNRPSTEDSPEGIAQEQHVGGLLRRRPLHAELEQRRRALVDNVAPPVRFFDATPPFQVWVQDMAGAPFIEVPAEQIRVCDLTDPSPAIAEGWHRPAATRTYAPTGGGPASVLPIRVALDPVLGRLAFPIGVVPAAVRVSAAHAFAGDLGGGPYDRGSDLGQLSRRQVDWQMGVSKRFAPVPGVIVATLAEALAEWNVQPPGRVGLISVMDNEIYQESLVNGSRIQVGEGSELLIVAAGWPELPVAGGPPGQLARQVGRIVRTGLQPALLGDVAVAGLAPGNSDAPGTLVLDGLLIAGQLTVVADGPANLGRLLLSHCSLVPGTGGITVGSGNQDLAVTLVRSITGPIAASNTVPALTVTDSIVDGAGNPAIAAPGAHLECNAATVLGTTTSKTLAATDTLFTGVIATTRTQTGCVRFSFVPRGSVTPRRHRCQPDLLLANAPPAQHPAIAARLAPAFGSTAFGDPAYCQLGELVAAEIAQGAEDGGEMGAFHFLMQPQRLANLRNGIEEYLRLGLSAGPIFVT
ncbi:MAG: hypothetical protein IPK26_05920 [Planctomycetes bacterium]|nr:hypothetical protein [Planctomycetota bacterium]